MRIQLTFFLGGPMNFLLLFFLSIFTLNCFSEALPKNLVLISEPDGLAWKAGSSQFITLKGSAVSGIAKAHYRWLNKKSFILNQGELDGNAKEGFTGRIEVPKFSGLKEPTLHFEFEDNQGQTLLFKSGDDFRLPKIKGYKNDKSSPIIQQTQFKNGPWGQRVDILISEDTQIEQALLILNESDAVELVKGQCEKVTVSFLCRFNLSAKQALLTSHVQLTDSAGNQTKSIISDGAKQ